MTKINYNLDGKVAIVTGGSRGIGLELTRNLLAGNVKVAICGRKAENLKKAEEELASGENLLAVEAHIAKEKDVDRLFEAVMDKFSKIDILINNAGMNLPGPPVADSDPSMWQKIIDTNLNGTYLCSRKASQIMKNQKRGKIINISSIAAKKSSPGMGIYGIAKAGIEMLTRVLANELAQFNVQVNAVAPGMVRTGFSKPFWSNEEIHDMIVKNIPAGKIADIIDVVHPVLFLASEGANYITGQTIIVDGGSTIV